MISPFIAIAISPNAIKNTSWLNLIYNQMNFHSEQQFLIFIGLVVIIAFYLKSFLAFNAQKTVFRFSYGLKGELSCKLLKAYIEAPYSYHLRINSATLVQNIINTTDGVCVGILSTFLTFISNSVIVLALILLLIKTNAIALILIAVLLLISFGLLHPMKDRLARWSKDGFHAYGEIIRITNHGLGGLKETRIIGCESYFENQMEEQSGIYAQATTLASAYGNLPRFVIEPLMMSFLIGFTFLFITLNQNKTQNLTGVLGIFALASVRLLPAVGNLISGINVIRGNSYSLDRLFFDLKELEKENLITDSALHDHNLLLNQNQQKFQFLDQVILDQLTFQYPNTTKNVLEEISLSIRKGESIGLIGKSGAGKTTLVDVLLGLFTPQFGDIKVDGVSVYSNLRAWQNMLGYVPQSIFLIDDTLERNIAFGVADHLIDQNRLKKAIEMAQLSEVVEQLSDGVKTIVGERGVLLSGGQRQRVGIARVLYHEREILVFDEATAALDTETEHLITQATKVLAGTKTIIIIAHRLSTIEHCDCIYQLEQGRILKSGSYQEVIVGR
ncbi:ABC transporter ATP-binding protein/permease [Dolichospermum sp. ST_sed1]|nr:ABC transporter ATP-binding protein/permease [Dolichospermum sp. ST_sed1]MDD1424399.1 ABC transporter ATP-binding protein/permease [Dolichospermum sp. ST_sed9]MDD1430634.1 ABC transporter ATP-binding protein/permease [Dolichospermum sp. ST_sed6]MDD1436645.1 ABC transporter ATP-binding protein/permease [Dolichospermum sp. ST_sed10]MDD1439113.1 ABC transporter ATP-binding protein/permease [Dolichospermum sp. ST_sed3]MDD1444674.1 ABC transporter ATP-binding protein/permease [Dolichospermum sp.